MNRVLDIFYVRFFTEDGESLSIGGVETYIINLITLASEMGVNVRVFQFSKFNFFKNYGVAKVYGIKRGRLSNFKSLYKKALSTRNSDSLYVNIIANDTLIPNWKVPASIVIQHGIGFDGDEYANYPQLLSFARKVYYAYRRINRMKNIDEAVCVDNNYICWYRTQTPKRDIRLIPILNFTKLSDTQYERNENVIKIVFARRFVYMRGTKLFAPVAKLVLEKYNNVEITFAGTGPEENELKKQFENNKNVTFTTYKAENSVEFHQQFDIAVVPTVYSEGTSLSLLEAMSAKCAVVCTNVGGMTNIILNQYNGLMISPNKEELFKAVSRLIEDGKFRKEMALNAYATVKESFSIDRWKRDWANVIDNKFNDICLR